MPARPNRVDENQHEQQAGRDQQAPDVQVRGIETCDHEDRTDIIDDGQSSEKYLHRQGHALAEIVMTPRTNAISVAIGMPQPCWRFAGIRVEVDDGGHDHAADRRDNGQCGLVHSL